MSNQPIIIFRNNALRTLEISHTPLSSIQSPDVAYVFTPTNNDWFANDYLNTGTGSYIYSPLPVPLPQPMPNILKFIQAVMADTTIPTPAQMGLAAWYPQLQMFIQQPPIVKSGWANLILTFESTWLTSQVQTSVLAYALEFNIPLV